MSSKHYIHQDVWIGGGLTVLCTALFLYTRSFPGQTGIFPRFALGCLIFLGVFTLVNGLKKTKKDRAVLAEGGTVTRDFTWQECKLPAAGYLLMVLYVIAIKPVGFFASTTVFMLVYMWFLKIRKPAVLALVTICVDIFLYALFVFGLKLPLPRGILM